MAKKVAALVVVIAALCAGVLAARAMLRSEPELGAFRGARLGMTASAVRARFDEPELGSWQSLASTTSGDVVLAWSAVKGPREARFEFHNAMLVAVRAIVEPSDAEARRPEVEVSKAVARVREGEGATVRVTILARDCPTHAAEAAHIAARR